MIPMKFLGFYLLLLLPLLIPAVKILIDYFTYRFSTYAQLTEAPYWTVRRDLGKYGEYMICHRLQRFEKLGVRFLFNVYIPKENGETTEIDVLMLTPKGIFVFESKNYSGWIFGSEGQKNWYQTLPSGRGRSHKEHFYNPIMQNQTHIKHLSALLGEHIPMHSVIVFSERCTLKSVSFDPNHAQVVNRYDIVGAVIAGFNKYPQDVLDAQAIANIYQKLYPYTYVSDHIKNQHVQNIHNKFDPTPAPSAPVAPAAHQSQAPACPRCHSPLVLRTATKGENAGKQFYGCSNYPKCRYIQNL